MVQLSKAALISKSVRSGYDMKWTKTEDAFPEKLGIKRYEHVRCLVVIGGRIEILSWNCQELCWDTSDGDYFYCEPCESSHWMALPAMPIV